MSYKTFSDAARDWVDTTYGASFNVTWGSQTITVKVFHDNQAVKSSDVPAVRFNWAPSDASEGSPALTDGLGAFIVQGFTDKDISPTLMDLILGQIEDDAKRKDFASPVNMQFGPPRLEGAGSIEPTGLYQQNLRIPFRYLEAA